jgi:hypothetical protein
MAATSHSRAHAQWHGSRCLRPATARLEVQPQGRAPLATMSGGGPTACEAAPRIKPPALPGVSDLHLHIMMRLPDTTERFA